MRLDKIRKFVRFFLFLLIFIELSESQGDFGDYYPQIDDTQEKKHTDNSAYKGVPSTFDLDKLLLSPKATANTTGKWDISPITLDQKWGVLNRLLFLSTITSGGTIMNGFYISSFFVVDTLRKAGLVFMACMGLSDMFIVSAIVSTSTVVLLSGQWDETPVCRVMFTGAMTSCYSHSMFNLLTALESQLRIFGSTNQYEYFTSLRIDVISFLIYVISAVLAGFGVYGKLDADYCVKGDKGDKGNQEWRYATGLLFHGIPYAIAGLCYGMCALAIKRRAREQPTYRRSNQYCRDYEINVANIVAYVLQLAIWSPYVYATYYLNYTDERLYYHSVWLGLLRSALTPFIYITFSDDFRTGFVTNFHYCCGRRSVAGNGGRHRRYTENAPISDTHRVQMHMLQGAVGAPLRSATAAREMLELR